MNRNLPDADFTGARLRQTDLSGSNLERASFFGADLRGANFTGVKFNNANLRECNLGPLVVNEALTIAAKLNGACMRYVNLSDARMERAIFTGADLTSVNLIGPESKGFLPRENPAGPRALWWRARWRPDRPADFFGQTTPKAPYRAVSQET